MWHRSTGALILLLTYGYRVQTDTGDPLIKIVEDAMLGFAQASEPNAFWVDRWPIRKSHSPFTRDNFYSFADSESTLHLFICGLRGGFTWAYFLCVWSVKYIPEWMPGALFRLKARLMREDREKLYDVPFEFVKEQIVSPLVSLVTTPPPTCWLACVLITECSSHV